MWGDNLVMQVPRLKVSVCAFPPKQGAVVNLYQLPVGVVTKVPEESRRIEMLKHNRIGVLSHSLQLLMNCYGKSEKEVSVLSVQVSVRIIVQACRHANEKVQSDNNDPSKWRFITDTSWTIWISVAKTTRWNYSYVMMRFSVSGVIKTPSTNRGVDEKLSLSHCRPSSKLILDTHTFHKSFDW